MIKINKHFSVKKYKYGWELHHTTKSKSEKSKPGQTTHVTWHPNLRITMKRIVDLSCGKAETAQEITDMIDKTYKKIDKIIKRGV